MRLRILALWRGKLSLRLSIPLVWILDRLPRRSCLQAEVAQVRQFATLMADADINRIVREKPVDYLGLLEWLNQRMPTEKVQ